jgi:hypothetical protein
VQHGITTDEILCRRSKSQSFARAIIQSILDHLNFVFSYICHLALLWHVFPHQASEVLSGASLPTGTGPDKVTRAAQRIIIHGVPAKFFAEVIVQRLDTGFKRLERLDDRRANQDDFFV